MFRINCCLFVVLLGGGLWALGLGAQDKPAQPAKPAQQVKPAQPVKPAQAAPGDAGTAIQATADAFVKAYNAHDAKAIATLFLPEALVYDEDSKTFEGRENIEAAFDAIFKETPEIQMELGIHSVDMIGKTMAVEVGISQTTEAPGLPPDRSRYVVLHVEREGQWKMAFVRDMPDQPTPHEHLLPLAWMVGEWVDESREARVSTTCRWDESRNFLLQDITVQRAGDDAMKISQRIGWDPVTKHIKAWMFDSEGGHGESLWTARDNGWLIKATGVRTDGSIASATNSIELDGFDAYGWRSVDRIVGNEIEPDVEVRVVRRAPAPTAGD